MENDPQSSRPEAGGAVLVASGDRAEMQGQVRFDSVDVATGAVTGLGSFPDQNPVPTGAAIVGEAAYVTTSAGSIFRYQFGSGTVEAISGPIESPHGPFENPFVAVPGALIDMRRMARLDVAAGTWSPIPDIPPDDMAMFYARYVVASGNRVYVTSLSTDTQVFDDSTGSWASIEAPQIAPAGRPQGAAVAGPTADGFVLVDELGVSVRFDAATSGWEQAP